MKRMDAGKRGTGGFTILFPMERQYMSVIPVLILRIARRAIMEASGTYTDIPDIFLHFEQKRSDVSKFKNFMVNRRTEEIE